MASERHDIDVRVVSIPPDDPTAALAELEAQGLVQRGAGDWRDHAATDGTPTRIASERLAALRGDAADRRLA